jgi:hypothetical protein
MVTPKYPPPPVPQNCLDTPEQPRTAQYTLDNKKELYVTEASGVRLFAINVSVG